MLSIEVNQQLHDKRVDQKKDEEVSGTFSLEAIRVDNGLQSDSPPFWRMFKAYLVCERNKLVAKPN